MTRSASWLLVLLLFSGFAAAVALALRARADAGRDMPEYSIYSEERNGLADAARLLRRWGWEPEALTRPFPTPRQHGLLLLVSPELHSLPGEGADLSESEVQGLLRWVEAGNALLVCGRQNTRLHSALDVVVSGGPADDDTPHTARPGEPTAYLRGVESIETEGRDSVRGDAGLPLWTADGRTAAVVVPRGKGRVLVVADPSLLTRRHLHKGTDNALFLYNLAARHAAGGRVYFDEYHHGLESAGGFWGYLHYHGQQWVLVPLLLAVAVGLWALAVRLGPAVPTPREARADAVDYASAVARIYEQTGARAMLARGAALGFMAELTRHLRLRRTAFPAQVLAAWKQRYKDHGTRRLEGLLRGVLGLRKGDVTDRQLLSWVRAFDEFQTEVLHAR
ncbi:MAG TPA: DUF4350 domain-containing protein [Gemmataceae bacterium]|nr:DUF4350 domain-containing protein [Gemmataceae bacterium]